MRPVAYVVLRAANEASPQTAREIREFVRTQLASYKCPRETHFLKELPKTATGKTQRFRPRAWAGRHPTTTPFGSS